MKKRNQQEMPTASMPSGVEHSRALSQLARNVCMPTASMPSGVEHVSESVVVGGSSSDADRFDALGR